MHACMACRAQPSVREGCKAHALLAQPQTPNPEAQTCVVQRCSAAPFDMHAQQWGSTGGEERERQGQRESARAPFDIHLEQRRRLSYARQFKQRPPAQKITLVARAQALSQRARTRYEPSRYWKRSRDAYTHTVLVQTLACARAALGVNSTRGEPKFLQHTRA
jgi:hypothetical protein